MAINTATIVLQNREYSKVGYSEWKFAQRCKKDRTDYADLSGKAMQEILIPTSGNFA
jgi:hypothetical protein